MWPEFRGGVTGEREGDVSVMIAAMSDLSGVTAHVYQVRVQRCHGVRARWRGRVVTIDSAGRRRSWPLRRAHTHDQLVATLWEQAILDLKRQAGQASATIVEVSPRAPL